ncbi:MAG: 4Fe-4S dicluster domain-containing protein [Thermodesulfobacteriota bacterium]
MFIKTNFDLCTGCRLCQFACAERAFDGYNPRHALLKINPSLDHVYHFPVVCNQCQNAYCRTVCPAKAVSRDQNTGVLTIDQKRCIGCGLCAQYCPLDVIIAHPEDKKFSKCDLCGGDPQCVRACPTGALELVKTGVDNA